MSYCLIPALNHLHGISPKNKWPFSHLNHCCFGCLSLTTTVILNITGFPPGSLPVYLCIRSRENSIFGVAAVMLIWVNSHEYKSQYSENSEEEEGKTCTFEHVKQLPDQLPLGSYAWQQSQYCLCSFSKAFPFSIFSKNILKDSDTLAKTDSLVRDISGTNYTAPNRHL
jgi:hypothetical protein